MAPSAPGRTKLRPHGIAILAIVLAAMTAYMAWRDHPPWLSIEGQTLTWRFQLRGPVAASDDIVILAIDDRTIAALGAWPLPRSALARTLRLLEEDGARVVAFDLLLAALEEPTIGGLPGQGDQALIAAVRDTEDVILPFAFVFDAAAAPTGAAAIEDSAFHVTRNETADSDRLAPLGVLPPFPALRAASGTGHVNAILDPDGSLRFLHPVIGFDGGFYPAMAVEAARRFLGVSPSETAALFDEGVRLGNITIRTDAAMRMPLNYYGPGGGFETVSLDAVLRGEPPAGRFRDRLVLIGATATGIGDNFATPFAQRLPGVGYIATATDNILTQRYLRRADWAVGIDLAAIAVLGLTAGSVLWIGNGTLAAVAGGAVLLVWPLATFLAFSAAHWWLNATFPTLTAALVLAYATGVRGMTERRLRQHSEQQRNNLARFVSPALSAHLAATEAPAFEERTQTAGVLFVDLRGFTTLSETLGIDGSTALLRDFHRRIESAVARHGGVLDKFMGDGAMAVFGLPEPKIDDAVNAMAAARDLASDMAAWSRQRSEQQPPAPPLPIGIGLHYGSTLIARLGGAHQHQITATGDVVNVASRLQDLSRDLGVTIVASDTLVEAVRALDRSDLLAGFEQFPRQRLRGRSADIGIWALSHDRAGNG